MIEMANLPALTPTNFAEAMQFADALAKSTMVPREYQRQPANILVALQWGQELGLGPLQALQSIAVINGRPAVYGDAMLALVRGSPHCADIIERIVGSGDEMTAECQAMRKGASMVTGRFSVSDAKRAALWGKAGPWKQYPLRMLQLRARGFALRDAFPDVLRGVISAEEAADIPREPKDVTPQPAVVLADALDAFAGEDTPEPETPTQRVSNEVEGITGGDSTRPRREPISPTEAEIDRSQERIADVLGPEELSKLNAEDVLFSARAAAFDGRKSFGGFYGRLRDDEREILRPHLKELQNAARLADGQSATDAPE
jgi:hypothetical protein